MKKLLTVLVGVLLTMPVAALDSSTVSVESTVASVSVPSVTGTCWVYYAGHWWMIPC
jgi:hypothetical protein